MKKFFAMLCIAAAVAGASSLVVAEDDNAGEKKFVLHGEIRQRADFNDNLFDLSDDTDDSFLFFPYRARIAAEGHFGKGVIGYIEMQGFGFWGDVPPVKDDFNDGLPFGPVGGANGDGPVVPVTFTNLGAETNSGRLFSNDIELYQAYINLSEIGGSKWDIKIGRQEIVRGTEFLLGDNDFYDGISHDALMGSWNAEHFSLDIFWTRPLQRPDAEIDGTPPPVVPNHDSVNFYGAYLNWDRYDNGIGWAAYALYYQAGDNAIDVSRRDFWTYGGRVDRDVEGGKSGFFFNAEAALQTGEYNVGPGLGDTGDIKAMGFEGMLGFQFGGDHNFRVRGWYDMASGDDDGTDTDAEGFDPLFQDSHYRYGFTDRFAFTNLTVFGVGFSASIGDTQTWGVDYFNQAMTEEDDVTGEDQLGQEVDGWWKLQYNANTQIMVGAAYFMPGDEFDALLAPGDADTGIRLLTQVRLRW
jgi:hypothetical protein